MSNHPAPAFANGKVCYLEIPAVNAEQSATFYQKVFGWNIRKDNGCISFDDTAGQVSGMWVEGKPPATNPQIMISIMVFNMNDTIKLIIENNGRIIEEPGNNVTGGITLFADPYGNVFCLYQHSTK